MDEVLGTHNDDLEFARYLYRWREFMAARIAQAAGTFAAVPGIDGLILAGSNGAGTAWPLSDIDLIPIYQDAQLERVREAVEQVRLELMAGWSRQGWRTGLDIGRLYFTRSEVDRAAAFGDDDLPRLLQDDRWYHAIDKAYCGKALSDAGGGV